MLKKHFLVTALVVPRKIKNKKIHHLFHAEFCSSWMTYLAAFFTPAMVIIQRSFTSWQDQTHLKIRHLQVVAINASRRKKNKNKGRAFLSITSLAAFSVLTYLMPFVIRKTIQKVRHSGVAKVDRIGRPSVPYPPLPHLGPEVLRKPRKSQPRPWCLSPRVKIEPFTL